MVEGQFLLGIDLGTMGVKTGIYSICGKEVNNSYRGYPSISLDLGWKEQDQNLWWIETRNAIKTVLRDSKLLPEQIIGISCCGQSCGPSPIDKDGGILAFCITHEDRRAAKECRWIREHGGLHIHLVQH